MEPQAWARARARDLVGLGVRWDASGAARCTAIAGRPPQGGFPGGGPRGRRGQGKRETWLPVGGGGGGAADLGEARTNREHHGPHTPLTLTLTLELQGAIGRMYPNERLEFRGAAYNPNPNPSLELRGAAWNPNPDGGGQPEPQARIEGRGLPVGGERTWRFSQLLSLPVGGVPASCRPRVGVDSLTWCRSVGNQPPTRHHV